MRVKKAELAIRLYDLLADALGAIPAVRGVDIQREVLVGEGKEADLVATIETYDGQCYRLVLEATTNAEPRRAMCSGTKEKAERSRSQTPTDDTQPPRQSGQGK